MSDNFLQHTKYMPSYQYELIETCTNLYKKISPHLQSRAYSTPSTILLKCSMFH